MKAFYFQPDEMRPELALGVDVLASEGYGEIIGGGQRIHDYDLLLQRMEEHNLPQEAFDWYMDLRRFGSVPHGGFGMGVERAWPGCAALSTFAKPSRSRECCTERRLDSGD